MAYCLKIRFMTPPYILPERCLLESLLMRSLAEKDGTINGLLSLLTKDAAGICMASCAWPLGAIKERTHSFYFYTAIQHSINPVEMERLGLSYLFKKGKSVFLSSGGPYRQWMVQYPYKRFSGVHWGEHESWRDHYFISGIQFWFVPSGSDETERRENAECIVSLIWSLGAIGKKHAAGMGLISDISLEEAEWQWIREGRPVRPYPVEKWDWDTPDASVTGIAPFPCSVPVYARSCCPKSYIPRF